jgi:hypothetical protein
LRTLTTAHEVHSLTTEEAQAPIPFICEWWSPTSIDTLGFRYSALFVYDSTGGIYVKLPEGSTGMLSARTVVDVRGVSGAEEHSVYTAEADRQLQNADQDRRLHGLPTRRVTKPAGWVKVWPRLTLEFFA